jgi:hypothetical protein
MKINYELKAKKNMVVGEFGYGIMWLFLSLLTEMLLYFEILIESYYHILAFILFIIAVYKFVIAVKKYRNVIDEKT